MIWKGFKRYWIRKIHKNVIHHKKVRELSKSNQFESYYMTLD